MLGALLQCGCPHVPVTGEVSAAPLAPGVWCLVAAGGKEKKQAKVMLPMKGLNIEQANGARALC